MSSMKAQLRDKQRESDELSEKIEAHERTIGQLRCGYEYDSVKRSAEFSLSLNYETIQGLHLDQKSSVCVSIRETVNFVFRLS